MTDKIGFAKPRVIWRKEAHSPAPSSAALSYNSLGIESKNPFRRKMEKPLASPGSTSAAKVFSRWR